MGQLNPWTHNSSYRRRVFPGNQLHWYWQPKIKHNTTDCSRTCIECLQVYIYCWHCTAAMLKESWIECILRYKRGMLLFSLITIAGRPCVLQLISGVFAISLLGKNTVCYRRRIKTS